MLAKFRDPLRERRRHMADMADDIAFLIDLDGLERDRARHRMAAIGEAVAEGAETAALLLDDLAQFGRQDHR